jgi:DNA-binding LytR/AlgR family response regulator
MTPRQSPLPTEHSSYSLLTRQPLSDPQKASAESQRAPFRVVSALQSSAPMRTGDEAARDDELAALRELVEDIRRYSVPRASLRWIVASVGTVVRIVCVDDVLYFQSATKYTRVVTAEREFLVRMPIRELLEQLDPSTFWQIHRSTIINVRAIDALTRTGRDGAELTLKARGDRLKVSDKHAHLFRQM